MSEIPLFLVSHLKTNRTLNDMAKVQIKSEKLTPIGGFFRFANKIPLSLIGCEFEDEIDL